MVKIYRSMPQGIKNVLDYIYYCVPDRIKYRKAYFDFLEILKEYENKSLEEKRQAQFTQLKELLLYAYNNTEYYKKIFDKVGFRPHELVHPEGLKVLPFLTKETVMEHREELIAKPFRGRSNKVQRVTTGGTTGKQMVFYEQKHYSEMREQAYFSYLFRKAGYTGKEKMAVIRNNVLPKGKIWVKHYRYNKIIFDPFNLDDNTIPQILQKLNRDKIMYFHAYPSTMTILSKYMTSNNQFLTYIPKAIFLSSESLSAWQKELIENNFGCKAYIHYGHSEKAGIAGWCLREGHYHIEEAYGYMELIGDDGCPIDEEGVLGEIVCTGFNNPVMPLIRYKTADYAEYVKGDDCCHNYRCLTNVTGRWKQEMLVSEKGTSIPIAAVNVHSGIFDRVKQFQYYQNTMGTCVLRIVKDNGYGIKDELTIRREIGQRLGPDMVLKLEYRDSLPLAKSGKFQIIISEIQERDG